jgi:transketolase
MRPLEELAMRDAFAETAIELYEEGKNIVVLDADVSGSTRSKWFAAKHPERFINVGIAEQNMMSIAAGMASCGMIPLVCSFSMLLSLRALDQLRQQAAYPQNDVKVMAHYGGYSSGPEGPTHHAIEDVGIMRSIPNITILVPGDAEETAAALRTTVDTPGAVFLRMCRNAVPRIEGKPDTVEVGKGYRVRDGNDLAIIAMGVMVSRALDAAEELAKEGIECQVVAMPSLKPIDVDLIAEAARQTGAVVTVEEHNIYGGLGSAVAEVLVEHAPVPMRRVGIQDRFAESAQFFELLDKYGLSVGDIVAACRETLGRK